MYIIHALPADLLDAVRRLLTQNAPLPSIQITARLSATINDFAFPLGYELYADCVCVGGGRWGLVER